MVAGVLLLAASLLTPRVAEAGAWGQPAGEGLAVFQYYLYATNTQYSDTWQLESMGGDARFVKNEFNLYLEYGIYDRFTLIGNFFLDALENVQSDGSRQTNFGFADQEVAVRYQLSGQPPQALQLTVKIPGPYDVNDVPALGNGQTDVELTYFYGGSFRLFGKQGFYDAGVGFRLRTGAPADELRGYLTTGLALSDRWEVWADAQAIFGLGNSEPQSVGDNILLTTDFSLIKAGVYVVYRPARDWAVQVGPYAHIAGRATGAGGGFKVAIFKEF